MKTTNNEMQYKETGFIDTGIVEDVFKMLEEGESVGSIANELELPKKDILDIYGEWKQQKMDKLDIGDKVCFVLNMEGYDSKLVHGKVHSKLENAVVVDCPEDEYVKRILKGRVAVSVKDIFKM